MCAASESHLARKQQTAINGNKQLLTIGADEDCEARAHADTSPTMQCNRGRTSKQAEINLATCRERGADRKSLTLTGMTVVVLVVTDFRLPSSELSVEYRS